MGSRIHQLNSKGERTHLQDWPLLKSTAFYISNSFNAFKGGMQFIFWQIYEFPI